ncbi:adhesin [Yersinia enterocolitica]|nr:adhesin [Yersinia enterocolitica]
MTRGRDTLLLHSNYDSVQEQTSIFAGKGGFDITVGEHTQLDGAVIASTATADKNTLDTGTLGFSNIENKTDFKADHQGVVLSSGGPVGSDLLSNLGGIAPTGMSNDVHAKGTTQAAVSDGHITIPDTDKQQQNVTDLSRDVEHANNALSPIFDKEKEQNRLRKINLIGDIGNQVADIARTQGKIAEEKALKDPKAIQAAKEALAENGNLTPTNKQLVEQIRNTASASYGTGSDLQRAIQAATAITQGLTGGNLGQALAGGSAPYLAHEISKYLPADQSLGANLIAHAVLGAVVGHFSGNATVGAVSAFTAEAAAPAIIKAMGWDKDSLTEKQKQTVSALATLAAGLAGGLVGDSSSSAVAGAQAGKNAVENNFLSDKDIKTFTEKYAAAKTDAEKEQLVADLKKLDADQQKQALSTGISIADQKAELEKLKQLAASPDCTRQCRELTNYSISQLEPVVNNTQLHKDNLTKAVLASTIIALTLEQSGKTSEKAPATGTTSASKSTSAIDDIIKGEGQAAKGATDATNSKTINNRILDNPRVGAGEKGTGSGNKVDQQPDRVVTDINGKEISIYSNDKKPFATQEFSAVPKAHGFNDIVDNYAGSATTTNLNNGATLYQLEGSLNGVAGRFEWIVDPKLGGVSHRMFVSEGKINGVPSKP